MSKRSLAVLTLSAVLLGAPPVPPAAGAVTATLVKGGLDAPAAFTFAPDGRVFYGELTTGEIHILSADFTTDTVFATVHSVYSDGGGGILGIALDPAYPASPLVYIYATQDVAGVRRNHILVYTDTAGTGSFASEIWTDGIDVGPHHRGGVMKFGPDGKLYVMVGEEGNSRNAQNLANDDGKMLRMNADGTVPADNPFPGSRIFSYGHRNTFGWDFDPVSGKLWEGENGPECNDELNRIKRGANFGWGKSSNCSHPPKTPRNTNRSGPSPQLPEKYWKSTIAPVGVAFCDSCGLAPADEGAIFMGDFNTGHIRRFVLTADRHDIASGGIVFTHTAPLLSMEAAPDGALYFSDFTGIYKLL